MMHNVSFRLCLFRRQKKILRTFIHSNPSSHLIGKIPEESKALSLLAPATPVPNLMPGGGLLPIPSHAPLQNVSKSGP